MVFDLTIYYLKIFLHIFHILNNVILPLNHNSCIVLENIFILVFKLSKLAQNWLNKFLGPLPVQGLKNTSPPKNTGSPPGLDFCHFPLLQNTFRGEILKCPSPKIFNWKRNASKILLIIYEYWKMWFYHFRYFHFHLDHF